MAVMLRRGAPLTPFATMALGGLAAAALGDFGLRLFHSQDASLMVLVWQFGTVVVLSVLAGGPMSAANAFLTLRVGEVARRYCELTSRHSPEAIRRSATAAAVQHLGRIVRENGALVVRKIWASTGRALIDSGVSKAEDIAGATRDLFGKISPWRMKEEESVTHP